MCWVSNKTPVLRKAEEPIPVFKILKKNMESVYMHFKYQLYTRYFQKLEMPINVGSTYYHIFQGIHSYDAEISCTKFIHGYFVVVTKNNLHSLDTFLKLDGYYIQVMGVIPEGAEYYRNEWGEMVSNSIILKEIKEII